jgi:histidine triad (HIT) family protein
MDCVFCKIINRELPSSIIFESDSILAFNDINPKAPIHILIVPKKHIISLAEIKEQDKKLISELMFVAKEIAKEKGLKGYKLIINVGREGGQVIEHLHLHLLSGKPMKLP